MGGLLFCSLQVGREDEFSINRQQMLARILVSMGGTVAEELVFGRDQVGGPFGELRTVAGTGTNVGSSTDIQLLVFNYV
jgi:hypothetical protein